MLEFFMDSAGANPLCCGAYFQGNLGFSTIAYALGCLKIMKDITFLELIPSMVAIEVWGTELYKKKFLFYDDNLLLVNQCY